MPYAGAQNAVSIEATRWLVENAPDVVQLHGHWPWLGVNGGFLTYARVPKLTPASPMSACAPVKDDSDSASQVKFGFVEYATRVIICAADEDTLRLPNSPEASEAVLAQIKLDYGYYASLDIATGISELGGLPDLVAAGNIVDPGGAALSFPCLEEAFDKVTANSGRPTVIMSNAASMRSYRNLCWAASITPPLKAWNWYDPFKGWQAGDVTSFKGVPWLINGLMNPGVLPADRRIYFMVLGDDGGQGPTRGVTGIRPADMLNRPYVKRTTNGVPDFVAQKVDMARDVWLTMPAGLALGSQGALSMLTNFAHVGACIA